MPLSNRTQAQYEASSALRRPGLIGVSNNARIEQRGRLERILVEEIGAHQSALFPCESGVRREGFFHFIGTRLEYLKQITVAALEILEDLGQLVSSGFWIERHDSVDDVIRPCLVDGTEVPRFSCRLERAHRSEEHTSELQSLRHLVCRLLPEKK